MNTSVFSADEEGLIKSIFNGYEKCKAIFRLS